MIPSFTRQKWFLLLGDVVFIILATYLSPLIRLGHRIDILSLHTGAIIFTLFLYLVMMYIFDLYNINRKFTSRDSALRAALAVGIAGLFATFLFYSLPHWRYSRGIFLIQMVLVWFLLFGWRWLFSMIHPVAVGKEKVLVAGQGSFRILKMETACLNYILKFRKSK